MMVDDELRRRNSIFWTEEDFTRNRSTEMDELARDWLRHLRATNRKARLDRARHKSFLARLGKRGGRQ